MRIAITGATGYIGRRLLCAARLAGHEVLALSRRPVTGAGVEWQHFDLSDVTTLVLPSDIEAVFHLAAETEHAADAEQEAAKRLIAATVAVNATFIFVSSQTAKEDAPTAYGRLKWDIEGATLDAGGLVIRPGQVYGGPERGLFGVLCRLMRRLTVLPAFIPAPVVQPIHVDDLVDALLACLTHQPANVISVAAEDCIKFTEFLKAIARGRTNRFHFFVPVPVVLVRITAKLLGFGLSKKLGLERLLSLFALRQMHTGSDLKRMALTPRPLSSGMTYSGRGQRELIREGRVLLTYLLRTKPANSLIRRYARAIKDLRTDQPLQLPEMVLRVPAFLAFLDGSKSIDAAFRNELDWRINAALVIAEASPQGARRFLDIDNPGCWYRGAFLVVMAGFMELGLRFIRLSLWPFLCKVGHRGVFR